MHIDFELNFFLISYLNSWLFTMTWSIFVKRYLKIFFFIKFWGHPDGELFDLVINFMLKKILQIIAQ